jgi:hypothetical protein
MTKLLTVLLLTLYMTGLASAQSYLLKLPAGMQVTHGGDQLRGFTLDEFKVILDIYADYKNWGKQLPELKSQILNLDKIILVKSSQEKLYETSIKTLKDDQSRLFAKWKEENRLRHLAENKPAVGSWIAWGAAGVAGTVAIVLGIVLAVQGSK